ncbi:hypothetical protein S7711_03386 [Stachybotrys chartarum IBT 7711]|uniref:Uncharacterized protein n=1 Tax=Stachybotrys chartarum (strain CBS 109288 / IBT 7711) TaxID=1280523 RepID=A0A084AXY1_STACB|nr:hypothetical protein S7711_03386 [Stachybotrys chartarum IBT 7711]KFA46822.1 hypothetical protein S40293_05611 [Stachybotrys chartarum IBT 40293]
MSDDKRIQSQSGSMTSTGSTATVAKASWSFSGTFSMSASASTSTSASWTSSSRTAASQSSSTSYIDSGQRRESTSSRKSKRPTIDSPFDFGPVRSSSFSVEEVSDDDEPAKPLPIAIPQTQPLATAAFVKGFPRSLRNYDIRRSAWLSFVDTVSGFLDASVSQQAINHAMDVATHISKRPQKLATNVATRTAAIGQEIGSSAKQGNLFGVAAGVIKGTVSIPLNVVMSTTTAVLGLPISTAVAVSKKPPTPRERATSYLAVANQEWLMPRRLYAGIVDTKELGDLLEVPVSTLPVVEEAGDDDGEKTEEKQFSILQGHVQELKIKDGPPAQIGDETLWLVVTSIS